MMKSFSVSYDYADKVVVEGLNLLSMANLKNNLVHYPTYRDALSPTFNISKEAIADADCPDILKEHCQQFILEMTELNALYNTSAEIINFAEFLGKFSINPSGTIANSSAETLLNVFNELLGGTSHECFMSVSAELRRRGVQLYDKDGNLYKDVNEED